MSFRIIECSNKSTGDLMSLHVSDDVSQRTGFPSAVVSDKSQISQPVESCESEAKERRGG